MGKQIEISKVVTSKLRYSIIKNLKSTSFLKVLIVISQQAVQKEIYKSGFGFIFDFNL